MSFSMPPGGDVALQDLQNEPAVVKKGAGARSPTKSQASVVLFDVTLPKLLAIEVVGKQLPGAVEEDHHYAIGGRRVGGKITPVVPAMTDGTLVHDERQNSLVPDLLLNSDLLRSLRQFMTHYGEFWYL